MIKIIDDFEKKTNSINVIDDIEVAQLNCGSEIKIYTISSIYDLVQYIGYAKYKYRKNEIFLRGQTDFYKGNLIPSLYRGDKNITSLSTKYNKRMNKLVDSSAFFRNYNRITLEPLLQHYGIKTTSIDVVDNIWVALWFATHEAQCCKVKSHDFVYYHDSTQLYSYIFLVASDAKVASKINGINEGNDTTIIDLRRVVPSFFLRPHAQHAYMIKKKDNNQWDFSDLIVGIVKISTRIGLEWIGSNQLLTVNSLFPNACFDSGYAKLLKEYPEDDSGTATYGSIQIIGG